MPINGEGESVPILSSSNRVRARLDPFLVACRCFCLLTSLAAILCIVVNVLSAIKSFRHISDIFDGIFRCYAVLISCVVVLAETEWGLIMKSFKALEYWPCRGMLQIFVAVMTSLPQFWRGSNRSYTSERSVLYASCLWCTLFCLGNPMYWLYETCSGTEGDLKRASSQGFGGVGTA